MFSSLVNNVCTPLVPFLLVVGIKLVILRPVFGPLIVTGNQPFLRSLCIIRSNY